MELIRTNRNFTVIEFRDFYNIGCSLQKSSIATIDCIWLGVNNAKPRIMAKDAPKFGIKTDETTGWVKYPVPDEVSITTRMHLSREQVKEILPHLQRFVETGEI